MENLELTEIESAFAESEKKCRLLRSKIHEEVESMKEVIRLKYKEELDKLDNKKHECRVRLNKAKVEENKTKWHPNGTTVYRYVKKIIDNKHRWIKTEIKGIVQTYDFSQGIQCNLASYNQPNIGDILVFYAKKDGSQSLKFDTIYKDGFFHNSTYNRWFADTDTIPEITE